MIYDSVKYVYANQYSLISLVCIETLKWWSEVSLFLLTSDIRSEGSIAIVKKFDFDFLWISILYHSHILKSDLEKKKSVSLCVTVAEFSRSNSISRILLKIYRAIVFSFLPTPKINGSWHKKIKNFDFLKYGTNDVD